MIKQLNQTYVEQVNQHRRKQVNDMHSLSVEYEEFIRGKEQQKQMDKLREKSIENSTLVSPTWIRDTQTQRDVVRRNQ